MSNAASESSGPQQSLPNFQVRIPLEWEDTEEIPIIYANQVMISHAGPEFFLVFGVVIPPTSTEELPDSLKIQPQVRVVVARDAMPAIVNAMNENLNRYRAGLARAQQGRQPGGEGGGGGEGEEGQAPGPTST